jgi:hypothetical protein
MPIKYIERTELSFHPYVKLLGYLCLDVQALSGDVVEIDVWKGKSLAFMKRFAGDDTKFIGIDPFELRGQEQEALQDFAYRRRSQARACVVGLPAV